MSNLKYPMISLDSAWRFSPIVHIATVYLCVSGCIGYHSSASGENLWHYLTQHHASVDVMDVVPSDDHFFLAGVRTVIIPWEDDYTPEVESIIPPQQRKLLWVLNVNHREQNLVWHREYPNLPDVNEVYSIAATANNQLCVVYGGEPREETVINPLVLRLDTTGESLWFKTIFPPAGAADSEFLASERIANLDAINVTAASNNACLVGLITRSVQSQSEAFRLHLIRYDSHGHINWHKILPTGLYGTMYLLTDSSASRHFVLTTNLSRDAALEAMILGRAFVPQIHITTLDSDGKVLLNVDLSQALGGVWLNNAIALDTNSLLITGKKSSAWLAHILNDGQVLSEYASNFGGNGTDAFQAIAPQGEEAFLIANDGKLSVFDTKLRLQSTRNIVDSALHEYANPRLSSQLPTDLAVEKIIPLAANHYLLFYKYGSRIVEIDLHEKP
jgi:hypothetical protein